MAESVSLPPQIERRAAAPWSVRVLSASPNALEAYATFCADAAIYAPPQHPHWIKSWLHDAGRNGLVAFLNRNGVPVMAAGLEVIEKGPLRVARFAGGSHANGNFPALHPDFASDVTRHAEAMKGLLNGISTMRPDVDLLALERQRPHFQQLANPFLALPHATSPNLALSADLTSGFDHLLQSGSGKRRRKKYRSQLRKLKAAGGFRRFAASSEHEVDDLLDRFFMLKRERLERKGLADAFGETHIRESLRRLFRAALAEPVPPFVLHGLEVGGKIRAVTGESRTADSIICEFSAFAEDELASIAPGDFLFYENVAEACAEHRSFYDFGVGDEPYKRVWCEKETRHADVFVGLNARGRLVAAAQFALAGIKRVVKQNPALARLAQQTRKLRSPARQTG